jgi:long-chain acyl-CoA synthetase
LNSKKDIKWAAQTPLLREAPSLERLDHIVWRAEAKWPARVALINKDNRITFGELADSVRRLASGFSRRGLKAGDRVVLQAPSSPGWLICYFSLVALGVEVIPLAEDRSEEGIKRALRLAEPDLIIVSPDVEQDIYKYYSGNPEIYVLDDLRKFLNRYSSDPYINFPVENFDSRQVASICFTSGTTGAAKGVCLTHANFCADLRALYRVEKFGPGDRFLSVLPSFHTYEFTGGQMLPMFSGVAIVYAERLTSKTLMKHFREDQITIMLAVPLVYQKIVDRIKRNQEKASFLKRWAGRSMLGLGKMNNKIGEFIRNNVNRKLMKKKGFKHLRLLISGGAPLNPEIPEQFRALGLEMLQGYGLTETSPVATVNLPGTTYPASVGKSLSCCRVGIFAPDEDGTGEIVVEGSIVCKEYLCPECSRGTEDDLFHTGDIGYIKDGFLFVSGRLKSTIVTSEGKNIYPEKLEEVYKRSPFIEEILVVGEPRSDGSGERAKAIVYPDEDAIADDRNVASPGNELINRVIGEELKKYGEELPKHERVRGYELRCEPFPRTPTRKIKRYLFESNSRSVSEE